MQTTAGSHTDLLTGILNVQVRNKDKTTEYTIPPAMTNKSERISP